MDQSRYEELMAVRLPGDVTPDRLPIGELVQILSEIEKGITALARQSRQGQPLPDDFLVALVSIREAGSTELAVSSPVPDLAEPAIDTYSQAIRTNELETLPELAQQSIQALRRIATRRGVDLEVIRRGKTVAVVRQFAEEELPGTTVPIEGGTSLFGVVEDVGGATPRIALRIPPDKRIICAADEDLCKKVGTRLYTHVVLEGTATWDAATGELRAFRAQRLGTYKDVHANEAFNALRRVFEESG